MSEEVCGYLKMSLDIQVFKCYLQISEINRDNKYTKKAFMDTWQRWHRWQR